MAGQIVGVFSYEDGSISGPATYMQEQGNARLESILSGYDAAFNVALQFQPDIVTCILVMMQTDYAGWKGSRQFFGVR
jgi:hypothetical protein